MTDETLARLARSLVLYMFTEEVMSPKQIADWAGRSEDDILSIIRDAVKI